MPLPKTKTSDMYAHQLCMKISKKHAIKSKGPPWLAVISDISIHQNVCID